MYVRDFRFRKPKFLGGRVTLQSPGMSMKKLCNFKYILETKAPSPSRVM